MKCLESEKADTVCTTSSVGTPSLFPTSKVFQQAAALCTLAIFTSIVTLVVHTSRRTALDGSSLYSPATSVLLSEIIKFLMCSTWEILYPRVPPAYNDEKLNLKLDPSGFYQGGTMDFSEPYKHRIKALFGEIFSIEARYMAIPALLYVFQGIVQVMSMSMVSATVYQTLYQLKIASVALFSAWLLGTKVHKHQWLAIFTLTAGVFAITTQRRTPALEVFFDPPPSNPFFRKRILQLRDAYRLSIALSYAEKEWRLALGIIYVIVACSLGSLAGVYIEYGLKRKPKTRLSLQNAQLSAYSIITTGIAVLFECMSRQSWSTFHGLGLWAWAAILVRALVGFVVSYVLKYSGSIAKTFATCFGIVITSLFEFAIFHHKLDTQFFTGFILIVGSTYLYSRAK